MVVGGNIVRARGRAWNDAAGPRPVFFDEADALFGKRTDVREGRVRREHMKEGKVVQTRRPGWPGRKGSRAILPAMTIIQNDVGDWRKT